VFDDEIPTKPPTFEAPAGPPPPPAPEPEVAAEPVPAAKPASDVRKWVGAGIGVVAIAVAALVGTGIVRSDAQADPGGRGGFPGGRQQFNGNGGNGFPGGGRFQPPQFGGGQGGFPGGGFQGGGQGSTPSTTPKLTLS
jgi:hypothetical protein